MSNIEGAVVRLQVYQEEGRTDWALSFSKLIWFMIWVLFPISLFRFVYDLFGLIEAGIAIFVLLILLRMVGPANLVMLDELLSRIAPSFRSAVRYGLVRVHDFQLRTSEGRIVSCILRGDLEGTAPMRGDILNLDGNVSRGCFIVRNGRNRTTGAVIAPRPCRSIWILIGTLFLVLIFVLYLTGSFDAWIYDWAAAILGWLGVEEEAWAA